MANLPYDKRDNASILAYLKAKAEQLSNGKWTDFSDADIGTVLLKLMSYLADMNNFQIDKGLSELYIDTLTERESAMSLIKLIGYEPRYYLSASADIDISLVPGKSIANGTIIPAYSRWSDTTNIVSYYNIEDIEFYENEASATVYEGIYYKVNYTYSSIDVNGRVYLSSTNASKNTFTVTIANDKLNRVDNALLSTSTGLNYSVHNNADGQVYIQLPISWTDFIVEGTPLTVEYLATSGEAGRIGTHIITTMTSTITLPTGISKSDIVADNNLASEGGYDPETIDEIKVSAPQYASTMDALVTLADIEGVKSQVPGISDIIALDYNFEDSGLVAPQDAYKVNVYVLPEEEDYIIAPDDELSTVGKILKEYIDNRRMSSIMVSYKNVEIITPNITMNVYMNKYDLRVSSIADNIKNFILEKYAKGVQKIGSPIYSSTLANQIITKFNYIKYLEIVEPSDKYTATWVQYLKIIPENITINVIEE